MLYQRSHAMGDTAEWDARYRRGEHASTEPDPLLLRALAEASLARGASALDLPCGAGRHAIYLAERGWSVLAIDGSSVALELLDERARAASVQVSTKLLDLEQDAAPLASVAGPFDLVCVFFYLNRALMPAVLERVRPGGHLVWTVHAAAPGVAPGPKVAGPGELRALVETAGWTVLYEGVRTAGSGRAVAELVARKASSTAT
ncbi:MAG: class I SAM-dependent methyltransferase [Polyangiaceae bacterium]